MDIRRDVNVNVYALYAKPKPTDRSPIPGELMLNVMSVVCISMALYVVPIPSENSNVRVCA